MVSPGQPGAESGACVQRVESGTWEICPLLVEYFPVKTGGEPGDQKLPVSRGGRFSATLAHTENRETARYRLTRDNQRRPKEVADVGVSS